jgi:hypothetical protein
MNIITKLLLSFMTTTLLVVGFSPVVLAANDSKTAVCEGVGAASNGGNCTAPSGTPTINGVIRTIINLLSVIIGVVAVVMIMVGGIKYITSQGESSNVASAKNTILYAVIGLIIVALAQTIAKFVLSKTSKAG